MVLGHEAFLVRCGQVEDVQALERAVNPLEPVPFDDQQSVVIERLGVGDEVGRRLCVHLPRPVGVLAGRQVDLVDVPPQWVLVLGEEALDDRVQLGAVRRHRHRLESSAALHERDRPAEMRILWRHPEGWLDRRLEEHAVGIEMDDEGAELLADPERAVRGTLNGLDVEITTGQQPLGRVLVDDRKADRVVRVAERDEVVDEDLPGAATGGLPVRSDVVEAQQEICRVLDRAETVVGHRPERTVVVGDDPGEPGNDVALVRWGAAVLRPGKPSAGSSRPTGNER